MCQNRSAKGPRLSYDCHRPSHVDSHLSATSRQLSYDKSLPYWYMCIICMPQYSNCQMWELNNANDMEITGCMTLLEFHSISIGNVELLQLTVAALWHTNDTIMSVWEYVYYGNPVKTCHITSSDQWYNQNVLIQSFILFFWKHQDISNIKEITAC